MKTHKVLGLTFFSLVLLLPAASAYAGKSGKSKKKTYAAAAAGRMRPLTDAAKKRRERAAKKAADEMNAAADEVLAAGSADGDLSPSEQAREAMKARAQRLAMTNGDGAESADSTGSARDGGVTWADFDAFGSASSGAPVATSTEDSWTVTMKEFAASVAAKAAEKSEAGFAGVAVVTDEDGYERVAYDIDTQRATSFAAQQAERTRRPGLFTNETREAWVKRTTQDGALPGGKDASMATNLIGSRFSDTLSDKAGATITEVTQDVEALLGVVGQDAQDVYNLVRAAYLNVDGANLLSLATLGELETCLKVRQERLKAFRDAIVEKVDAEIALSQAHRDAVAAIPAISDASTSDALTTS